MTSIAEQLKPQLQSPLEWWYVHGRFSLSGNQYFYFVFTIFRNRFFSGQESAEGYQVILSITGPLPDQHWQQTWIDPVFFNGFISNRPASAKTNVDISAADYYFSQLESEGPPENVILKNSSPEVSGLPFAFLWESCEFRTGSTWAEVHFRHTVADLDFSVWCTIDGPLVDVNQNCEVKGSRSGMSYLSKTRMPITGTFNRQPLEGQAWLDHQWGDYRWLMDKNKNRGIIKGWKWLGINFDNGQDLIIWKQFEAESRTFTDCFVVLFINGHAVTTQTAEISILKEWFSHKTDVYFPVSLNITVPDLSAELQFIPVQDDQEISLFGLMRSVWQGAGRVTGLMNGAAVVGFARLELAGFDYIHNMKDHFVRLASRIDQSIEAFFPRIPDAKNLNTYIGEPLWVHEPAVMKEMISEPVWDLMDRSGKRWRPLFAYYLIKSLGVDPRPYEQAIFVLAELIHTGSLIIDDIQDDSPMRRGAESIHLRYGQDLAITAANTLYFLPSLLIMDHPVLTGDQKQDILQVINRNMIKAHFGQSMDIYWSKQYVLNGFDPCHDPKILERIPQIYALKTGSTIQGLAEVAAVISNTGPEIRRKCGEFAQDLGIAYQIIDDILNFSDHERWGKQSGEDLAEGKLTFVIAYCIKQVSPSDRRFLIDLIQSPLGRKDPARLAKGLQIISNSGSFESCREMALSMVNESWNRLSPYLPASESRVFLRLLIEYMIAPLK